MNRYSIFDVKLRSLSHARSIKGRETAHVVMLFILSHVDMLFILSPVIMNTILIYYLLLFYTN